MREERNGGRAEKDGTVRKGGGRGIGAPPPRFSLLFLAVRSLLNMATTAKVHSTTTYRLQNQNNT